jgi:hypothetical protein
MTITWEVVAAFLTVFGAVAGVWGYLDHRIRKVADDLSAAKLHAAETYITKQGVRETVTPIMDAMSSIKQSFEHLNARIDSLFQKPRTPSRS